LRIAKEDITFYIAKVQAPYWYVITSNQWEDRLLQLIDEHLGNLSEEQRSHLPYDSSLSDDTEAILTMSENSDRIGEVYKYKPFMNRNEMRPVQLTDGENFLNLYMDFIDSICRKDNPNFPLYINKVREVQGLSMNRHNTADIENHLEVKFAEYKIIAYQDGYNTSGSVDGIEGGGNLPLDANSMLQFCKVLFDMVPRDLWESNQMGLHVSTLLHLCWIGCGFGEECVLIALLAKEFNFPIKIDAMDISRTCVQQLNAKVDELQLQNYINVKEANLYKTAKLSEKYDIVYTSAVVEQLFSTTADVYTMSYFSDNFAVLFSPFSPVPTL
jgi:hypothetical protein